MELIEIVAEGVGFEPTIPVSQDKRLAGARTRPLCDPSGIWDINIADWGFGDNLGGWSQGNRVLGRVVKCTVIPAKAVYTTPKA